MTAAVYCLRGDLSDEMQVTDPNEDARLDRCILDASRVVDIFCREEPGTFAPQTLTKLFDVPGSGLTVRRPRSDNSKGWYESLAVPPLLSVTTLKSDDQFNQTYSTAWTAGIDYFLEPYNQEVKRLIAVNGDSGRYGFPQGQQRIQIVGSWGITEDGITPFPIRRATFLLAMNYYRRPSNNSTSQGLGGAAVHIGYQDIDVAAILWEVAGRYRQADFLAV